MNQSVFNSTVSNGSNQSNSPMDSSEIGCNDSYQGSTKFNVEPAIHDSSSHHNYKLIVDPAIHGGVKKVYRHNGIFPGDAQSVHVYDPRSRMRWFATKKEALDLIVPSFTIDEHYIGAPREVTFINLNNNINIAFLKDMCKQFGRIGSAEVFYHPKTRRHLGIGKVVFSTSHAAQRCVDKLNQTTSMGNLMTVTLDLAGRQRRRLIADLTSEKDKGLGLFCPPCPTSALPADLFAATSLSNDNSVKQLDNSKNKPGKVKSERPKQNQNNSSKSEHKHAEPVEKAEKTLSVVHNSTSAWKQEFDENTLALMQTAESAESATHDRQKSYNQRSSLDSSSTAYPVTNVDYRPEVINDSYIGQQQHEQQQSSYWKSDRMQVKHDVEANMATSRWSSSDDRTEQQADQDLEGSHLRNYHSVSDRKRNRNGSDVGDRHSIKSDRRHQQDNGSHHSRHHDNHSRDSENYRHGSRANNRKDDDRYNDQWYNSNKQQGDRYQMDQGRSNRQSNYDRHRDSIDGHGHRQRYDSDRYNRRSDYSKPDNYSRRVDDRNRSNERKNKLVASDWRKSPADRPWQPTDWKRNSSDTLEHALDQSKPSEDHFSAMNNSEITDFETMPYDMPANESCEDGLRDLTINEHMIRPPSLDSRIQSLLSQTADADPNTASLFNSVQFFSQDSEREEAGTVCPEQTLSNIPATASISDTSTLQPAMDFGKKPEHQYSSDRQAFDNKVFGCEPQRLFSAPPPGAPFLPDCNLYPQPPSQQLLPTVDAAISSDCNDLPCTSVESSSVQPLMSVGIDSNDRFGRDSRHSRHGRDRQSRCRDRKNSSSRDDHGMDAASYGHDVKRQQQGQWHVEGSTGYNCAGSGQWQPTVEGPQLTKTQEELGNWQTTYSNQNCDMGGSNQWTSQQSDFSSYDQSHMQPESAVDHWQNLQNQQYCSNQGFDNTSHQQQQQVTSEGALAIQSYQNNEQNQMSPIDRWFLRQSDGVIEELVIQLKLVLIRDLKKKMIESTGFRGLDDWWNARLSKDIKKTAVDVNKASVAIANDSTSNSLVENPSSSAAPINDVKTGGKQPMTSLTSLFENMDNSGVGLGGLLGIRSGAMAQLPSFRRKVSSAPEPAVAVPASTVVTHDKREARSSQKAAEEEDRNRGPHTPDRSVVSDNEEDNSHDESDRSIDESSSESESDRAVLKIGSSRAKVYSSSSSSSSSGGSRSSSSASSTSSSGEESDDESGIEEEPKKAVVTRKRTTIRNLSKVYVSDDEDDDDDDDDNDEDDDDDQENEDIEEELKTAMAARRTGVNKFSNVYDSDDDEEEANDVHEDLAKALPESGDELPAETGLQSSTKTAARDKLEDTKLPTKSADSVDVGALLKPVNKMKSPDNIVSEGGLETVGGSNVKKEVGYEIEHLDDIDVVGSLSPGEVKEEPDHSCKAAADTKESSVSDTGAVLQANGSSEAAEKVTATEPSSLAQPHVSPVKSLPPPSSHVPIQVIDLRHLEDHNYAHPYQPVVGRPKKKSSVSKNIDTVDTDSDAETLSIAEDSLKLVPCLPESLSQEHCYCRRYQPTEDYSLDWSDADSDYQFPGDLHLSNTVDKLPEMMDMVDTFSRERGIADSSQPVRKRQKLSDVTNTSWSRELAGLLPKPVRVKFNSRGKDAEKCIELDILLNGLDWEDRDYIRRQYERLSLGSGRDMPEWIRKTHWSDHPITVKPEISTPRKRKWKHNNRRFDSNKCARTEIYTKIGRDEKMVSASNNVRDLNDDNDDNQLPVVNTVSESDLTLARRAAQQSREARSESRRWQTVLTSYCDEVSDLLKFNQLKFRKKILKFARSGIHDWGLFALERIAEGEMVIEYVGEVVRQTVADVRERRYVAKGIGSSYLFRIDSDAVVDATYQGNLSRFVNHSCMPNCYAKIITVESKKKIVIYSRRDIQMNEEITYDYKFPFEDVKIPCHCRASSCRGSLN